MARLTIKDLKQSDDLDREAMRSIVGGSLTGTRPAQASPVVTNNEHLVEYPPGFGSNDFAPRKPHSGG
jgi:hypothetical protein